MDDDPMINDAGKHSVKIHKTPVSLRPDEWGLGGVNTHIVIPGSLAPWNDKGIR